MRRQCYWAFFRKRLPSRVTFLAGEDMDLPFPSPPFASADHDDPFATRSIHRINTAGSSGGDELGMSPYTIFLRALPVVARARGGIFVIFAPTPRARPGVRIGLDISGGRMAPTRLAADGPAHVSLSERRPNARRHRRHGPASSRTRNGTASFFLGP